MVLFSFVSTPFSFALSFRRNCGCYQREAAVTVFAYKVNCVPAKTASADLANKADVNCANSSEDSFAIRS